MKGNSMFLEIQLLFLIVPFERSPLLFHSESIQDNLTKGHIFVWEISFMKSAEGCSVTCCLSASSSFKNLNFPPRLKSLDDAFRGRYSVYIQLKTHPHA